jgi:hypothetical protein
VRIDWRAIRVVVGGWRELEQQHVLREPALLIDTITIVVVIVVVCPPN